MAMAKLLVAHRPVWILDEPTAALDVKADAMFAGLCQAHLAEGGMLIAATHQPLGIEDVKTLVMKGLSMGTRRASPTFRHYASHREKLEGWQNGATSRLPLVGEMAGRPEGVFPLTLRQRGSLMAHSNIDETTRTRARTLRRERTHAERKMWDILRDFRPRGASFRRETPIGPYIADFAWLSARIVVEVDGDSHETEQGAFMTGSATHS